LRDFRADRFHALFDDGVKEETRANHHDNDYNRQYGDDDRE
jgi:hypothetical protein